MDVEAILEEECRSSGGDSCTPPVICDAAIVSMDRVGTWSDSADLLRSVLGKGGTATRDGFTQVLRGYNRAGEWQRALALLEEMTTLPSDGGRSAGGSIVSNARRCQVPVPDVSTFNAVMGCCVKGGQWRQALALLRDLEDLAVRHASTCSTTAALPTQSSLPSSSPVALESRNTSAAATASSSSVTTNEDDGEGGGLYTPDSDTLHAALRACDKGGQGRLALSLLERFGTQYGVTPTTSNALNSALNALTGRSTRRRSSNAEEEAAAGRRNHRHQPSPGDDDKNGGKDKYTPSSPCESAVLLLSTMASRFKLEPDQHSFSIVARALAAASTPTSTLTRPSFAPASNFWSSSPAAPQERGGGGIVRGTAQTTTQTPTLAAAASAVVPTWVVAKELVLEAMPTQGLRPTPLHFSYAITACGRAGQWRESVSLLDALMQARAAKAEAAKAKLATATGAAGASSQRRSNGRVSDDEGVTVCHNAVLGALANAGRWQEAVSLLENMIQAKRNAVAAEAVSPLIEDTGAAAGAAAAENAELLVEESAEVFEGSASPQAAAAAAAAAVAATTKVSAGYPDVVSFGTVLKACGRAGEWEACLALVEGKGNGGGASGSGEEGDGADESGGLKGLGVVRGGVMAEVGVQPNEFVLAALLKALGDANQLQRALALFHAFTAPPGPGTAIEPDLVCFNTLLHACAVGGDWRAARKVLRLLLDKSKASKLKLRVGGEGRKKKKKKGLSSSSSSSSSAAAAAAVAAAGLAPDTYTLNAMLEAYEKGGQWRSALRTLNSLPAAFPKTCVPDCRSARAVVGALGVAGEWGQALTLLNVMEGGEEQQGRWRRGRENTTVTRGDDSASSTADDDDEDDDGDEDEDDDPRRLLLLPQSLPKPDLFVYCEVVAACGKAGQWEKALNVLQRISSKSGLSPDLRCYNAAAAACSAAGRWREALLLLPNMVKNGVRPDVTTFNTCLVACARGQQWTRALVLLRKDMPRCQVSPDVKSYTGAMAACEAAGEWEVALSVLGELRQKQSAVEAELAVLLAEDTQRANTGGKETEKASTVAWDDDDDDTRRKTQIRFVVNQQQQLAMSFGALAVAVRSAGKLGDLTLATQLLDEMREKGFEPDVACLNAVLAACERMSTTDPATTTAASLGIGGGLQSRVASSADTNAGLQGDSLQVAVAVLEAAMARPGGLDLGSLAVSARLRALLPITWPVESVLTNVVDCGVNSGAVLVSKEGMAVAANANASATAAPQQQQKQ